MQCPRCHAGNRAGLKFCEDCGARLATTCAQCGAEVTPGKNLWERQVPYDEQYHLATMARQQLRQRPKKIA